MSSPPPPPASASVDESETMEFECGNTIFMDLAKRAVDAVLGRTPIATSDSDANCSVHSQAFHHCLNSHEFDDMGKCHYYVDMLADCCRKSTC